MAFTQSGGSFVPADTASAGVTIIRRYHHRLLTAGKQQRRSKQQDS
jgi:hypothetical protein